MESQIERTVKQICENVPDSGRVEILALGGDVRFAASRLLPDWNPDFLTRIDVSSLEDFTDRILGMSEDAIVRKFHLSFPEAETIGPALLTYLQLAAAYGLDSLLVADVNLRDGMLKEMAVNASWTEEFSKLYAPSRM